MRICRRSVGAPGKAPRHRQTRKVCVHSIYSLTHSSLGPSLTHSLAHSFTHVYLNLATPVHRTPQSAFSDKTRQKSGHEALDHRSPPPVPFIPGQRLRNRNFIHTSSYCSLQNAASSVQSRGWEKIRIRLLRQRYRGPQRKWLVSIALARGCRKVVLEMGLRECIRSCSLSFIVNE